MQIYKCEIYKDPHVFCYSWSSLQTSYIGWSSDYVCALALFRMLPPHRSFVLSACTHSTQPCSSACMVPAAWKAPRFFSCHLVSSGLSLSVTSLDSVTSFEGTSLTAGCNVGCLLLSSHSCLAFLPF